MNYTEGYKKQVENLKKYLLNKISFKEFESNYEKTKESYEVVFKSSNFKEFSKKLYKFFPNKKVMVKDRLEHEKRHGEISIKHGFKVKYLLKSYEREGEIKYRPSVIEEDSNKLKKKWSKTKLWQYSFDQVNSKDPSDNDKIMLNMLIEIRDKVFKK